MLAIHAPRRINPKTIAINWMNTAIRATGNPDKVPFNKIAGKALEVAETIYYNQDNTVRHNAQAFRTHLGYLHKEGVELGFSSLNVPFRELPCDDKTTYELVLLSAAIAINKQNPQRVDKVAHLDDKDAVENWLENIWRARHEYDTPLEQDDLLKRALNWESTSGALGYAMNDLVLRFGGTFNLAHKNFIKEICEKAHGIMIQHNLWGEDTKKYNVSYEELPQHLKDDYVLMVMAAITGFSENAKQDRTGCDNGSG